MQKGPSETAVVQISRTEYITKCYRNMVDRIPQKRILRPRNQWESHCLHRRHHIWNSRTSGAPRHHGAHAGTPAWTKAKPFIKWAIPLKDIPTCSSTDIYHMCRTRHFRSKGQCVTEIQLLNTPQDRRCCRGRQAMTPLWCSSINALWFPQKLSRARSRPGVGATAILATKITWWHDNADGDCSRFKLQFAFNKQDIGWYERKWPASCYDRD